MSWGLLTLLVQSLAGINQKSHREWRGSVSLHKTTPRQRLAIRTLIITAPGAARSHVHAPPGQVPNTLLTKTRQSPLIPFHTLDKNKRGTYKNIIATREMQMLTFIKDFAAFVTLGAFTIGSLTWMDVIARLV